GGGVGVPPPADLDRGRRSVGDFSRAHGGQAAEVPGDVHDCAPFWLSGIGAPLARLSNTASVARVVAVSDDSGTGIGEPERTASTNAASSAAWPLSRPRGSRPAAPAQRRPR